MEIWYYKDGRQLQVFDDMPYVPRIHENVIIKGVMYLVVGVLWYTDNPKMVKIEVK